MLLPIRAAHQLEPLPPERRWLIDTLWADQAVGIVGGEPKCCKSFLALDLALAVASGAPCLRRFPPAQTGRVLLYAAEDALHVVRQRLHGIALAAGVDFATLDIQVITAPSLRLDHPGDQARLRATVEALRPALLVLDPFVRLHRLDENAAAEVAPLLADLRDLQRHFHCAVLLVHHARKGAAHLRAGQALRGSSELHAWGDSNLYLRRQGASLRLTIEHRAAPGHDGLVLELRSAGDALALHLVEARAAAADRDPARPASRLDHVEPPVCLPPSPAASSAARAACATPRSVRPSATSSRRAASSSPPPATSSRPGSRPLPFPASAPLYRRAESESGNAGERTEIGPAGSSPRGG